MEENTSNTEKVKNKAKEYQGPLTLVALGAATIFGAFMYGKTKGRQSFDIDMFLIAENDEGKLDKKNIREL